MSIEAEQTKEILKKVRQVEIRSRRMVSDSLVGAYKSVFKGTGIDFEEVREYQLGDDVRSIDWNVTAKMDKPFLKLYREERELTIMLLVDLSASGDFGSVALSKRELAAELASVLAFSAVRNNDKVGLALFTDEVEKFIPPKKGRQHVLRVIREILFFEPKGSGTHIPRALDRLNHVVKRKAIAFLISDFLTEDTLSWIRPDTKRQGDLMSAIRVTHSRHDLICIELSDPRETDLPDVGIVTLEDAETGELVEIDTSNRQLRQLYHNRNRQRRESLLKSFRQSGADHFCISTDKPYLPALRAFLLERERRR